MPLRNFRLAARRQVLTCSCCFCSSENIFYSLSALFCSFTWVTCCRAVARLLFALLKAQKMFLHFFSLQGFSSFSSSVRVLWELQIYLPWEHDFFFIGGQWAFVCKVLASVWSVLACNRHHTTSIAEDRESKFFDLCLCLMEGCECVVFLFSSSQVNCGNYRTKLTQRFSKSHHSFD